MKASFLTAWVAFSLLYIPAVQAAEPLSFHVAPSGDDSAPGTVQKPLRSIPAALAAARAARLTRPNAPAAIVLHTGIYPLDQPLELGPEDSNLRVEAAPSEQPVLSGGVNLSGWKPSSENPKIWETTVADVAAGKWYFRVLYINGQRKQRARTPNQGYFRIDGPSPQDKPVQIHFHPGDIKKEWAGKDVELIALLAWADLRMPIRTVDEQARIAVLAGDPRPSNREERAQYFIENAPDALDSAGEWYLDRQSGVLRYWPLPGEDMTRAEAIAPRLDDLILVRGGSRGKPVRRLVLRGLAFRYTNWQLDQKGYADTQAAVATHGDLFFEHAVDCLVQDCSFSGLSGYGLELGKGCQRCKIQRNVFSDLGAGGVRVGEPAVAQDAYDENHGNEISDNEIHHLGLIYPPAVGVFILQSGENAVVHNHIHHLYYTAISVGWTWGYRETPCHDNRIEYNHLHDIGQFLLSDMGAVYTLGIQKGTVVRNNLIHDVNSFTYGGWGLYPDEGSSGILFENNVVYRTKSAGFHQHYGRNNDVRNNVFAFGKEHQLMRTRDEPHLSFLFANNIVYFDSGDLLGSNWGGDRYVIDWNLYFDVRLGSNSASMKFSKAGFEEWKQRGHDVHSLFTDPLFADPARNDFHLRPESPALKMGFEQIDLSTVGVRPRQPGH